MRVRILAFATAATELGAAESEIELADGATIDTLRRELIARHPGVDALWQQAGGGGRRRARQRRYGA